jgi:hypothetical protein
LVQGAIKGLLQVANLSPAYPKVDLLFPSPIQALRIYQGKYQGISQLLAGTKYPEEYALPEFKPNDA